MRRTGSAAWLLDESDLAITLLQDAMQRLRAPGTQGTSGPGLTALGWAYIDTGRWDDALEAAAEAANREIGDRLFLSPRTVSSHLYRSYPKLGVAGRHQLRDVVARASTLTPAGESAGSETPS